MIMDLDHFKEINDTLGHHMGDLLLEEVARRLKRALRDSDTVARLGGDEFGVLLPRVDSPADASRVAQNLLMHLREPFVLEGMRLEIDASVGLALHPMHGEDNETLQQRADIAMYSAKQSGRGHAIFEPELDRHSPRRLALAGGLRSAINEGQIQLYYQPKADLRTGRIMGAEALARWDHPEFGIVGPAEFVPIAEQTGLITPLTSFVLDAALRQARAWKDAGLELSVAVNLSARSFLDTQLAVEIPRLLSRWGVEAELLELEITESMLMTDPARAEATLDRLSQIGLTLSVDDFGTGYSSLANLKRLPVDVIKIDKSFVIEMAVDASDAAIVRSTIELAHNLGLQGRRRGRRVRGRLAPPRGARLRLRPGLLPLPAASGRRRHAADPRARHGPRHRGAAGAAGRAGPGELSAHAAPSASLHVLLQRCTSAVRAPTLRVCSSRCSSSPCSLPLPTPPGAAAPSPVPRPDRSPSSPRSSPPAPRSRSPSAPRLARVCASICCSPARPPCAPRSAASAPAASVRRTWTAAVPAGKYTARVAVTGAGTTRYLRVPLSVVAPTPPPPPAPASLSTATSGLFPVQGLYSLGNEGSRFGAGRPGHTHQGQDVAAAEGTPVVTPRGGIVHWIAYQEKGAGHYVVHRRRRRPPLRLHAPAGRLDPRGQGRAGRRGPADRRRSATRARPKARTCTSRSGSTAGGPPRRARRSTRSRTCSPGHEAPRGGL